MSNQADFQPDQANRPRVGVITQWVDEKGYGWVEAAGKRFFAHIKDFDRGQRRPKTGEEVRFIQGMDPQGRACAKRVVFVNDGETGGMVRGRLGVGGWLVLAIALPLPLLALLLLPLRWWMGAGGMLVVSAIAYGMYSHDKQRAVSKGWRVSEGALHLAEILGGWPGAFVAQRRLRHKCSKMSYQMVFWLIVLLYQVAAAALILDPPLRRAVTEFSGR